MRALLLVLLLGCEGSPERADADAGAPPAEQCVDFDLRVGRGQAGICGQSQLTPPEAWPVTHVDPSAGPGGDGSAGAPLSSIAAALALGTPRSLRLAAGDYPGDVEAPGPLALMGAGPATRLVAEDVGLRAADTEALLLADLQVIGGRASLDVRGLDALRLDHVALLDPEVVALRAERVETVELRHARLVGAGERHIEVLQSALAMHHTWVGPGGGGLLAGFADPEAECAGGLCPFGALVYANECLFEGLASRGLELDRSVLRSRRSVVRGVGAGDLTPASVVLRQSVGILDDDGLITDSAGVCLLAESSQLHLQALSLRECAGGGVHLSRLAPEALRPFAGGFPESWLPARPFEARAFEGLDWLPDMDWYPRSAWRANQPPALLPGASVEADLHTWARAELRDLQLRDNDLFGVRLDGHAARLASISVSGTRGADSVGVLLTALDDLPLDEAGAATSGLSEVLNLEAEDNAGVGLALLRLLVRYPESAGFDATGVTVRGVRVRGAAVGVALFDSVADIEGLSIEAAAGVGLWLAGVAARIVGVEIADTRLGSGRDFGHGVVVQSSELLRNFDGRDLQLSSLDVRGSADAGLLVKNSAGGLTGLVRAGVFEGNARAGVRVGDLGELQVEGVELELDEGAALPACGALCE